MLIGIQFVKSKTIGKENPWLGTSYELAVELMVQLLLTIFTLRGGIGIYSKSVTVLVYCKIYFPESGAVDEAAIKNVEAAKPTVAVKVAGTVLKEDAFTLEDEYVKVDMNLPLVEDA